MSIVRSLASCIFIPFFGHRPCSLSFSLSLSLSRVHHPCPSSFSRSSSSDIILLSRPSSFSHQRDFINSTVFIVITFSCYHEDCVHIFLPPVSVSALFISITFLPRFTRATRSRYCSSIGCSCSIHPRSVHLRGCSQVVTNLTQHSLLRDLWPKLYSASSGSDPADYSRPCQSISRKCLFSVIVPLLWAVLSRRSCRGPTSCVLDDSSNGIMCQPLR